MASHSFAVFRGRDGRAVRDTTTRPALTGNEVLVRVTHSGLCGTDVHYWRAGCVLGHEGCGVVAAVGPAARRLAVGDRVGWGYVHDFCGRCAACLDGHEQHCRARRVYGLHDLDQGSAAAAAVWPEHALAAVPPALPPAAAAPLMCAGASVFAVYDLFAVRPTDRVGVVGLGGLGHLAVLFGARRGNDVVVFSAAADKRDDALAMGARDFRVTPRGAAAAARARVEPPVAPVDHLIVTTSAPVDWALFLPLLAPRATIYPLTVAAGDLAIPYGALLGDGLRVQGSLVAPAACVRRMLAFAAAHGIHPVTEEFAMDEAGIDEAMGKLAAGEVRYRAVLVAKADGDDGTRVDVR